MPKERTESEQLFDDYLTERDYVFESQLKPLPGKKKALDARVSFEGTDVYFEIKEFEEGTIISEGAFDPYKRIYQKLKDSWAQLNDYREYSCSVVLYNSSAAPVFFEPEIVLGAMLGTLSYGIEKDSNIIHKIFSDRAGFQTGHMIDYENQKPRSTQFSSVIILEKLPIGQIRLSQLLDEREKNMPKDLNTVAKAASTWSFIQALKAKGFDGSETALRVIVYENPYATLPLPRGLFRGPYDERWGSEKPGRAECLIFVLIRLTRLLLPNWLKKKLLYFWLQFAKSNKIMKIFEGAKLRGMTHAIRSYSKSPLAKAGILRDK